MSKLYNLIRQDLTRVGIEVRACSHKPDLICFLESLHTKVDNKIANYSEVNEKLYSLIEKKIIICKVTRALKDPSAASNIYGYHL